MENWYNIDLGVKSDPDLFSWDSPKQALDCIVETHNNHKLYKTLIGANTRCLDGKERMTVDLSLYISTKLERRFSRQ